MALCRHPYMGPIFHMRTLVQATSSFSQPASLRIKSNATTSTMIRKKMAFQCQDAPTAVCLTIAFRPCQEQQAHDCDDGELG